MAEPEGSNPRLWTSLRRLTATLAGIVRNRVELFVVELQEERYRLVELLLLAGAAIVLGVLSLVLFSGVVILIFPPHYRVYVAGGLALLYALGVFLIVRQIRSRLQDEPFTETVAQVKKDWECLTPPQ